MLDKKMLIQIALTGAMTGIIYFCLMFLYNFITKMLKDENVKFNSPDNVCPSVKDVQQVQDSQKEPEVSSGVVKSPGSSGPESPKSNVIEQIILLFGNFKNLPVLNITDLKSTNPLIVLRNILVKLNKSSTFDEALKNIEKIVDTIDLKDDSVRSYLQLVVDYGCYIGIPQPIITILNILLEFEKDSIKLLVEKIDEVEKSKDYISSFEKLHQVMMETVRKEDKPKEEDIVKYGNTINTLVDNVNKIVKDPTTETVTGIIKEEIPSNLMKILPADISTQILNLMK